MKYRKRPLVVDAVQYGPDTAPTPEIMALLAGDADVRFTDDGIIIPTLEGEMLVSVGDYLIRGTAGELYPCKSDIFDAVYEVEA